MSPRDGEGGYGYGNEPMTKSERDMIFDRAEPQDGPPCHDCGRPVWYNVWVSDEVWERVRPEPGPPGGGGVLCVHCIDRRCAEAGIETSVRMHWMGEALKPEPTDDDLDTDSAGVERLKEIKREWEALVQESANFDPNDEVEAKAEAALYFYTLACAALNREEDQP